MNRFISITRNLTQRYLTILLLFGSISTFSSAIAQEKSVDLDSILIATSRMDLTRAEADHQITIITEEQISAYPNNSLDELLRYVAGLEVQSRSISGAQADISIRGGTFNQVLVLLDGVRVNDPLTGHFNNYIPVALSEISRIEIVKGASSGIYGSDAVGGIIHVITKTFAKVHGSSSSEGQIEGWYGENNLIRINGGGMYERKKWAVAAGLNSSQSDGHLPKGDSVRSEFDLSTYSLSAAFTPNDKLSLNYRSALDVRNFNARYFYTQSTLDQSVEEVSRTFNILGFKYQHDNDQQTILNFGKQTTRDSFLFNPLFVGNYHTTQHTDINLYHLMKATEKTRITIGSQFLSRKIESNDRGNHLTRNVGIYWLVNQQIGENLNINGGLRLDHDPSFNWEASPQIGLNWRPIPEVSLRGFAGKSIRAADYTERYVSTNLPAPLSSGRNLGNPDLIAEKAWNYEVGLDLYLVPGLSFNSTFFYRQGNDIIDFVITPGSEIENTMNADSGSSYFYAQNFSRLNTTGAEVMLGYQKDFGKIDLTINAGGMILVFDNPDGGVSKYIANNAGMLANFSARVHHQYASISINGIYKDRSSEEATVINRELEKSYFVLNGRLDVHPFKFPLNFSVMVSNILDEDYADILGANLPGRWIQGGLSYRFAK